MTRPMPYQGEQRYIFVSYAHKDSDLVWPIIRRMQQDGCRIWYDEGIDPGTEWDQNIASHVEGCGYFIAFLSPNYLDSENCKDELNYARDLGKDRLLVYLEDVTLPGGMAMRLNRLQAVFWNRYENKDEFYAKLYAAQGLGNQREQAAMPALDSPAKPGPLPESLSEPKPETEPQSKVAPEQESTLESEPTVPDFEVREGVLVKYHGTDSEVVIPDGVTEIGDRAFEECETLTHVVIPEGVTKIGYFAFLSCKQLTSVVIPDSVIEIGGGAFDSCKQLTSIVIPNSVTKIGRNAFDSCEHLTSIVIPDSVTKIGHFTFHSCKRLTTIVIPDSVTEIGRNAFNSCEHLTSIIISANAPARVQLVEAGLGGLLAEAAPEPKTESVPQANSAFQSEDTKAPRSLAGKMTSFFISALAQSLCPACNVKLGVSGKCPKCGKKWS